MGEERDLKERRERVVESPILLAPRLLFGIPFQQEERVSLVGEQQPTSILGPANVAAH